MITVRGDNLTPALDPHGSERIRARRQGCLWVALAVAVGMALAAVTDVLGHAVDRDALGIVAGVLLLTAALNGVAAQAR